MSATLYRSLPLVALVSLCFAIVPSHAQVQPSASTSAPVWTSIVKSDPFTDRQYTAFRLQGKFIEPPAHGSYATPEIELRCDPKPFRRLTGKFLAGFVVVGAVLDLTNGDRSTVQFRLDDGKQQYLLESTYSTDYEAISFDELFLDNILWGHLLPHKPGSGGPVRKLLIGVQEHVGTQIVMQFDMPDPDVVSKACGAEYK